MPLRVSGMNSGLDTDSIIKDLVKSKQVKIDELEKEQTKLQWKQEKWKSINSEIVKFHSTTLSKLRDPGMYSKLKSTSSNSDTLEVAAGANSVEGTQTAYVKSLAKSGYLTGGELFVGGTGDDKGTHPSADTKVTEIAGMDGLTGSFNVRTNGIAHTITIDENTTFDSLAKELSKAGVDANYDEENGRFFLAAKGSGEASDFTIESSGDNSTALLNRLKLSKEKGATRIEGKDAVMVVNGAEFKSEDNNFVINGTTFTAKAISEKNADGTYKETSITTTKDIEQAYDTIVDMIKEYNDLMGKMDKLLNAEGAKGLEPLTDEEKDAISESEAEELEEKLKNSLLRGDDTLSGVVSSMHNNMVSALEIGGTKGENGMTEAGTGSIMFLSDFGITTKPYLTAGANEKHLLEISGENGSVESGENKLKAQLIKNPDETADFFSQLTKRLYEGLKSQMSSVSEFRTFEHVYNDKQMQKQYDDYTQDIKDAELELEEYEERWYDQFTAMEVALASINSKQSAISGMLGMQ